MLTVHEVSRLAGVSVRTLHHYDAVGLLKPTCVTQAGYRLYDDAAIKRLQTILFFRELQFSLKEIRTILDDPGFDQKEALRQQIRLLELQKERIGRLISYAQKQMEEGDTDMDFDTFDREELDRYKEEVKQRWGGTEAYRESEEKAAAGVQPDAEGLLAIFRELGAMKTSQPEDPSVQAKVAELQDHISQHFYTCTKEILKGLGEMYAEDERFRRNIDKTGGEGTAVFVRDAIRIYCSRN